MGVYGVREAGVTGIVENLGRICEKKLDFRLVGVGIQVAGQRLQAAGERAGPPKSMDLGGF